MMLKKIVVAEDDDAIAHMVNMALGDAGFLCLRARDGQEALNLVRTHTPDLLVLDVMMPKMDGIEVTKKLRADVLLSKTPILMLTALTGIDEKVAGFDAGADDYVTKPFDLRELSARVRALIRSAQRERERSPTTDLPGSTAIENRLIELLSAGGGGAAVIHVDLDGFDGYADRVGFARAEELGKRLGQMLLTQIRDQGETPDAFVGHLGGADFIIIADIDEAESIAAAIVREFESRRDDWVDSEAGAGLTLACAVVPVGSETSTAGGEEIKHRLASTLRAAKEAEGSTYVVWRPE
jgi:CheY-like chemotaxis protein